MPILYMLSRTTLTYFLFRATRGVLQASVDQIENLPDRLKMWECDACGKTWSGESDGEDLCSFCETPLTCLYNKPYQDYGYREDERRSA